jgi:antibiotic biosynthesis monooxygenase (ABM) superfamily enzyme
MVERPDTPSRAQRSLARVATTLGAWLAAFGVVVALLSLLGDELASLPLAVRALVMSGVLVALMVNLVMPLLGVAVERWLAGPSRAHRGAASGAASASR